MNTLFLAAMIVEAVFGLGFLFIPAPMLAPFGVTLDVTATAFVRHFGSALIAFPILLWYARKSNNPEFKQGAVYSLFTYLLTSTVLLLSVQFTGLMNALGWVIIAIHVFFLVWFGYYFIRKANSPA